MFIVRKKTAKPEDGYGLLKGRGRCAALEIWDAESGVALRREHARSIRRPLLQRRGKQHRP